jgi:hypothetical protein
MFASDNSDSLPPAGWASGANNAPGLQISWDSLINSYIGGHASQTDMQVGYLFTGDAPQILVCPADRFPKVNWVGGTHPGFALRSYSMVGVGPNQGANADYQRNPKYGLPDLNQPGKLGVGIYWADPSWTSTTVGNWGILGYKSTVVRDPAGTILLCENTHGQQVACNIWTCICNGPQSLSSNPLYQTDTSGPQDPTSASNMNEGLALYQAQKNRFNYVFDDGHVETLSIQQTIGTGTLTVPKGMWTAQSGD